MLKRMKDLGGQLSDKAAKAAGGVVATIGEGVGSLAGTASDAAGVATDKTIRAAADQLCNALQIAAEQLRQRPLPARRVSLTASVGLGATALQMQIVLTDDRSSEAGVGNRESTREPRRDDVTPPPGLTNRGTE
jgi:hypothetical protein